MHDQDQAASMPSRWRLQVLIRNDAAAGIVLMVAAALAMIATNTPLAALYFKALHHSIAGLSLAHWINDGLMALFFLLIGLEVKYECVAGQLSSWDRRVMPGAAAVAGMAVPACIYFAVNAGSPENAQGWAIPAATDIAFALGIIALLGSRVPPSLKVLLTAIAVIDDLLAIIVIAVFYTHQIAVVPVLAAGAGLMLLVILNRTGVRALWPYLLVGIGIWLGVLLSGIHATLAGVAVAMTIPLRTGSGCGDDKVLSPLARLEHGLKPWSNFVIVPIFGFANAGVSLAGMSASEITAPLPLGILLGLILGKPIGIFGTIWAMVTMGAAPAPERASWAQIHGMATLCGIGFTMSLFIGGLAFSASTHAMDAVKIGVFSGSILAGAGGWLLLRRVPAHS